MSLSRGKKEGEASRVCIPTPASKRIAVKKEEEMEQQGTRMDQQGKKRPPVNSKNGGAGQELLADNPNDVDLSIHPHPIYSSPSVATISRSTACARFGEEGVVVKSLKEENAPRQKVEECLKQETRESQSQENVPQSHEENGSLSYDEEKRQSEKNNNNACKHLQSVPHPTLLQHGICVNCKAETGQQNRTWYSQDRKIYQQRQNLVKVVARLDPASHALLKSIRKEFQLQTIDDSQCGYYHIVLAGSLTHETALEMRNRLSSCNSRLAFSVPVGGAVSFSLGTYSTTKDKCFLFQLAAIDPHVAAILESERQQSCSLPQWPLSIVLGYHQKSRCKKVVLNERLDDKRRPAITFSSNQIDIVESSCESTIHNEGIAAAIKKRACQEGCKNVPDPTRLSRLVCANCGTVAILKQKAAHQYRDARKLFNLEQNLVKIVAHLDRPSLELIESFRAQLPMYDHPKIDPRRDHVVLAGNLTRENAFDLRTRLLGTRFTFAVSGADRIAVSRPVKDRICFAITLKLTPTDAAAQSLLEKEREQLCTLPQWPVSISLGAGNRESSEVVKKRFAGNQGQVTTISTIDIDILEYSGKSIIRRQVEALISVAGEEEDEEEGEITDQGHPQLMDTMVTETDCAGTSTTDPMPCETCHFIPHPTEVEATVCCVCGLEKSACDSIVWYNDIRRQFLLDHKAKSISAQLDEQSRALVASLFLKSQGTDMACTASGDAVCGNITLVDGLMWSIKSSSPLLAQIQQTVRIAGTLEIVGSHCISMSDGEPSGQRLVVIDVRPDPRLASVLHEASQQSLVAQYPLRVYCGLVPCGQVTAIAERVHELVGQSLVLDTTSITVQRAS
jgi:hypothetical protein